MNDINHTQTFQGLIWALEQYWRNYGCIIIQPLDVEIGAATSHPMTFFHAIGSKSIAFAHVQMSRRPLDSRYTRNPNRLQQYYQFQVIIKPSPQNMLNLYLNSLQEIGVNCAENDIRFIEDNWENPTLGAYGLGWEVWLNGMEITQCTYFQKIGGLECYPVTGEITYGLERIALFLQKVDSVYNIVWGNTSHGQITYRDLYSQNELEQSIYNYEYVDVGFLFTIFNKYEIEASFLLNLKRPLLYPAYERILKLIHVFNLLDAKKSISVMERKNYVLRIQKLSQMTAEIYYAMQQKK